MLNRFHFGLVGVWLAIASGLTGCAPDSPGTDARPATALGGTGVAGLSAPVAGISGSIAAGSIAGATPIVAPPRPVAGTLGLPMGGAGIGAGVAGRGVAGAPMAGVLGVAGAAGVGAQAGSGGRGGVPTAGVGAAGTSAVAGQMALAGAGGTAAAASGETGRMVGMTAAHNAVRAMVQTTPALPPMTWSPTLAAYAQEWADMLAASPTTCHLPMHRSGSDLQKKGYGENLAASGSFPARMTTPKFAVDGWSGEVKCYTFGTVLGTEKCDTTCYMGMHSDGCGHYTQIVWRGSTQVGCGVASCMDGMLTNEIWICNYAPAGNIVGRAPY